MQSSQDSPSMSSTKTTIASHVQFSATGHETPEEKCHEQYNLKTEFVCLFVIDFLFIKTPGWLLC